MSALFLLVRIYPIWSLPLAFVLAEFGLYFRRKRSPLQFLWFGIAGFLTLLALIWAIARGDINSDQWVRDWFGISKISLQLRPTIYPIEQKLT